MLQPILRRGTENKKRDLQIMQVPEFLWLRERDLNPRPSGYEPDELPDCSIPRQRLPTVAELVVAVNLFFTFLSSRYCAGGVIGVKPTFGVVIPPPRSGTFLYFDWI